MCVVVYAARRRKNGIRMREEKKHKHTHKNIEKNHIEIAVIALNRWVYRPHSRAQHSAANTHIFHMWMWLKYPNRRSRRRVVDVASRSMFFIYVLNCFLSILFIFLLYTPILYNTIHTLPHAYVALLQSNIIYLFMFYTRVGTYNV